MIARCVFGGQSRTVAPSAAGQWRRFFGSKQPAFFLPLRHNFRGPERDIPIDQKLVRQTPPWFDTESNFDSASGPRPLI